MERPRYSVRRGPAAGGRRGRETRADGAHHCASRTAPSLAQGETEKENTEKVYPRAQARARRFQCVCVRSVRVCRCVRAGSTQAAASHKTLAPEALVWIPSQPACGRIRRADFPRPKTSASRRSAPAQPPYGRRPRLAKKGCPQLRREAAAARPLAPRRREPPAARAREQWSSEKEGALRGAPGADPSERVCGC